MEELGLDDLPAGEVLIEVSWSSVNYKDGMVTVPGNRVARISPLVPGVDLAGVVVASDDPFARGRGPRSWPTARTSGVARHGGYAALRPGAGRAAPCRSPPGSRPARPWPSAPPASPPPCRSTSSSSTGLRPGDGPVLVTGASGGVGSFAVALLAGRGYEVVASTGKADEHRGSSAWAPPASSGATTSTRPAGRVLGPEHWAGAVDCVGGDTLARVLRTLRYGAAVAASGLTGGTEVETTVYPFITRGVALLGVDSVRTPLERRRQVWARLATDLRPAHLDDLVAGEVSLHGVAGALADILAARVRGRLLVRVDASG